MWSFEHEPDRSRLSERYVLSSDTPAECAAKLASGAADIGLVPVAALAFTPELDVIPGCVIASRDRVRSIVLVVRGAEGIAGVRRVALDTASRTSAAYTRILFARYWKTEPEFLPHEPDLEAMLRVADAALLIGDPALLALEGRGSPTEDGRTSAVLRHGARMAQFHGHGLGFGGVGGAARSDRVGFGSGRDDR